MRLPWTECLCSTAKDPRYTHVEENVLLCDIFKWAKKIGSRGVLLLGDPGAGTGVCQFCWRTFKEAKEADLPG